MRKNEIKMEIIVNLSPFEKAELLLIGSVEYISVEVIRIVLDIEAPQSVALNATTPRPFPRVNGYVLLSADEGYLVAQIERLSVENSSFPKRAGMHDFGIVDLPYPLRKMQVQPVGMLRRHPRIANRYNFKRGAGLMPSVGASVLLPTDQQLRAIVNADEDNHVQLGTSPRAGFAPVNINPDRLFGRHLAVLGNTGSGKSCSVAGIIRWCLENAQKQGNGMPNARFIVLDPNGEYARAFSDTNASTSARVFKVNPNLDGNERALTAPLWLWNSDEWAAFTQASSKVQRPILIEALRMARSGNSDVAGSHRRETCSYVRSVLDFMRFERLQGRLYVKFPHTKNFCDALESISESLKGQVGLQSQNDDEVQALQDLISEIDELVHARIVHPRPVYNFTKQEIDGLIDHVSRVHIMFGGEEYDTPTVDADTPRKFSGETLKRNISLLAEFRRVAEYIDTLQMRIETLLSDNRMNKITALDADTTLESWLCNIFGERNESDAEASCISILDLSLVPTEIVHTVTAVIARVTFEALQRHMKINEEGSQLPTVLVLEEAHTFIKKYKEDFESTTSAKICCQTFERIAREGRKFGLGLVLSSQRPSELSPTVLSQCNTFLLHRISNDRDQDIVQRLVPDGLRGILSELPLLQSQNAILLGWATELPVLIQMNTLPDVHQPLSSDAEFWKAWTMTDELDKFSTGDSDWTQVANSWQDNNSDRSCKNNS